MNMPLRQYVEWVDAPGMKTTLKDGKAVIWQLDSHKDFSPNHTLDVLVCKTSLRGGCEFSSKLLPLVVAMWEKKEDERLNDFYSFDNNGVCLSHGYSRWKDGQCVVNEQHDTDVSRLVEYGEVIKEMFEGYPIPVPLAGHTTVIDLMNNCLRE